MDDNHTCAGGSDPQAVWRSHGLTVERSEGLYFCRSETPRFYPNLVTIDPDCDPDSEVDLIYSLSDGAHFEFSVKDSFDRVPLGAPLWRTVASRSSA